jgi:coproporphyrinogen III oxidase
MAAVEPAQVAPVRSYLLELQERICEALEAREPSVRFDRRVLPGERGGLARPQVLQGGACVEHAAVNFSHTSGATLPAAATAHRPELTGGAFEAVSVSVIVHPRNPYAPTTHANLRLFSALPAGGEPVWWFGGGFDLTPCYGFVEDAVHWHRTARAACTPFGEDLYPRLKQACDAYFHLPHRGEGRGIGGLFFDDWTAGGFGRAFDLLRSVGDHFLPAYLPLLDRRTAMSYGERERDWQRLRRGRYVEFNLLYDRGTRFGLQAGGRTASILASLPPEAAWRYDEEPEPGTPEAELAPAFLQPRDWLADLPDDDPA